MSGRRIFHLNADVVQTSFELLGVFLCVLVKHIQLHPQLLILYGPDIL